jgi:large subunit ribosomal protein L6
MSRIGRTPIVIPKGVTVDVKENVVTVKGPLGTLSKEIQNSNISAKVEKGVLHVTRVGDLKETKAAHGLYRALFHNMIVGVEKGYSKTLLINGVGFKAVPQGEKVVLSVGYSHTVDLVPPKGIKLTVVNPNEVNVSGIDKEAVGQFAAAFKAVRKPEPYHGYGIRYKDETILRKEGKAAGKGK